MLLYAQLITLILVGILHVWYGMVRFFYATVWWWDIPTHFLGGVWIGFFAAWVLQSLGRRARFYEYALAALAVGVAWEVFEHAVGLGGSVFEPYWVDTAQDMVLDVFGGVSAAYIARLWQK